MILSQIAAIIIIFMILLDPNTKIRVIVQLIESLYVLAWLAIGIIHVYEINEYNRNNP